MMRNFVKTRDGSVMMIVALAAMAVVGSVGVALDAGRSQMVQAKLQNSVDAAGLAAGATLNTADLTAVATKYVNLNFNQSNLGATLGVVTATLSDDKKILTITASATLPTTMTKIFGRSSVQVNATTEVTRSNKGLELALVLDTTGSMAGSKLSALQTASHDLLDILFGDDAVGENLWVGIVPFSQSVNIGNSRTNWLNAAHYASLDWGPTSWQGCVDARWSTAKDITDDPPFDLALPGAVTPAAPYERLRAYYWPDDGNNNWRSTNNNTVNTSLCSNQSSCRCSNYGPCATTVSGNVSTTISCSGSGSSRSCNRAVTTTTTTYNITGTRGPNAYCPSAITPLTNVKATVGSGIDALVAQGNTHVNFGAVWGWRLISPRWRGYWGGDMDTNSLPLNYNAPLMSKAVIIMTDGVNTVGSNNRSAYDYPSVSGITATGLDNKTTAVCNAMKAQGIIVYTILFEETSGTVRTLLRNCATSPDYFFDSPTESSLQSAFHSIGDSLANLRISK
ncbi:MAG: pilus assembly protein TadG-related protein [Rickettsiales bacterium]